MFCFNERSPGSCFFYPKGAYIYNTLVEFIRKQYRKRGFQEVISPNIYSSKLWETSGHWQHYAQNMFIFDIEKEKFGLKPMNCPGRNFFLLRKLCVKFLTFFEFFRTLSNVQATSAIVEGIAASFRRFWRFT